MVILYIYICLLQQLTANISPDLNILLEQSSCPSTLSLSCHLHRSLWDCILGCHSLLPIMVITILPLTAKCCHLASAVPDSCHPFTQGKPFNSFPTAQPTHQCIHSGFSEGNVFGTQVVGVTGQKLEIHLRSIATLNFLSPASVLQGSSSISTSFTVDHHSLQTSRSYPAACQYQLQVSAGMLNPELQKSIPHTDKPSLIQSSVMSSRFIPRHVLPIPAEKSSQILQLS